MVHVTDVKKITLMEQVADEYEQLGKEGGFSKKCIPRGYIPDFDWTAMHQDQDQPIKPIKQQDPTEDTTTPAAPTEVEGLPSSCLRSKTKQRSTFNGQGSPEHNLTPARSTGMQSSQNTGQHSGNCMKTLLLDAMDKTSLVHKENHQTPSPSGYKMHYCSSNGCI